jgi:hypothetical protein
VRKIKFLMVHHGNDGQLLKHKVSEKFNVNSDDVFLVDTSKPFVFDNTIIPQAQVNFLFEFTGYNYGVNSILRTMASVEECSIVVMNDTIFDYHFIPLYLQVYREFLTLDKSGEFVFGMTESKVDYNIIPTCFFCLNLKSSNRREIRLTPPQFEVEKGWVVPGNYLITFFANTDKLKSRIDAWLIPKSFLSGWYKVSRLKPITESEYDRKCLAIFLEHSMLNVLNMQGIKPVITKNRKVKLYALIDRLISVCLKLKVRVSEILIFLIAKPKGNENA